MTTMGNQHDRNKTWDYRDTEWTQSDLVGYDVEATDGGIGKIDEKTNDASASYVVVDTGFWIFGKKRLVPAGAISRVDTEDRTVFLDITKEQVKTAPDYDADSWNDDVHERHDTYYRDYNW